MSLVTSNTDNVEEKLLLKVLKDVNDNNIFFTLSCYHALETCEGLDNHYTLLVRLIAKKYLKLRTKNILKDYVRSQSRGNGNKLTRQRVIYHE